MPWLLTKGRQLLKYDKSELFGGVQSIVTVTLERKVYALMHILISGIPWLKTLSQIDVQAMSYLFLPPF